MSDIADRFRRVAAGLTDTIAAVPDCAWGRPSPCEGWTALDVVRHLVDWVPAPGFLLGAYGIEIDGAVAVEEDPMRSWAVVRDAVQAGLDDRRVARREADCGPLGRLPFEVAVDTTCTPDVLIHTWDLASAVGLNVVLDAEQVALQAEAVMSVSPEVDAAMRRSGHFGPRIEVAPDADELTRVLAFNGRKAIPT